MFKMVKKFFDFCSRKNRNKFYKSAVLGVVEAMFTAMKIPAAFFAIKAVVERNIDTRAILTVVVLMLVSTLGKIVQKGRHEDLVKQDGIYRSFIIGRKQAVSWKLSKEQGTVVLSEMIPTLAQEQIPIWMNLESMI